MTSELLRTMSNSQGKLGYGRDINAFLQELSQNATALVEDISDNAKSVENGIFVESIENRDNGKVRISVSVRNSSGNEGYQFLLLPLFVDELSLSQGAIDGEMLSSVEYFADVTRAFMSACTSFAYAEGSLRSLERKLVLKGFSRDVAADAVQILAKEGYVNECEIAKSRARVFIGKRWGKKRIYAKLREEGFSNDCLDDVKKYLSEVDFVELCAEHIEKKYDEIPVDRGELEKLFAALSRYGYSGSEISLAIKKISNS